MINWTSLRLSSELENLIHSHSFTGALWGSGFYPRSLWHVTAGASTPDKETTCSI